jgi:hypothetical protein
VRQELPHTRTLVLLAAAFAALEFVPDPLDVADRSARAASAAGDERNGDDGAAALSAAEEATALAPRHALPHLLAAALARDCRSDRIARREIDRAARAEPRRGPIQVAIANDRLVDGVEHRDPALIESAAAAFAAAVATDEIACTVAYDALRNADAPAACFDVVAGRDPERLEALVEHHACALASADACSVADHLDRLRADGTRRGRALAERRLGAACFAAGRARDAADHFRFAAELDGNPDGLALDRADAHFAAGDEAEGAKQLLNALASGEADAARAAGSIRSAAREEAAAQALLSAGLRARDADLRARCADVFKQLGQAPRHDTLLAATGPVNDPAGGSP